MRNSDKAIVLQTIKHGDKKQIVKLFTLKHGYINAFAVIGSSPKSKIKSAVLLPMNLLDIEIVVKQNGNLQQLNEASCYYVTTTINTSFNKLSIAQFINEILIKCLKEQAPNVHLFMFIETCIKYLNTAETDYSNLHLYFLIELSKYLGIEPQNNFTKENCFFDCQEGKFTNYSLSFPLGLTQSESVLFSEFLKLNTLSVSINHNQRQKLLNILVTYFSAHIPNFGNLKSLAVLQEIISV